MTIDDSFFLQDDSSQLHLKKKTQPATEASVASLQQAHQASVSQIFQGFDDSLSLSDQLSVPMISNTPAVATAAGCRPGKAAGGKRSAKSAAVPDMVDDEGKMYPALKCLKGLKDPVLAASKVRKATMSQLGMLESKCAKALDHCRDVLGLIRDDYDCQECDYCCLLLGNMYM